MGPAAGPTPSQGATSWSARGGAAHCRGRRPTGDPRSALRRLMHGVRRGGSWDQPLGRRRRYARREHRPEGVPMERASAARDRSALRRLLEPAAGPTPSRRGATVCSAGGGAACCSRCPPGTEINNNIHHRVLRGTCSTAGRSASPSVAGQITPATSHQRHRGAPRFHLYFLHSLERAHSLRPDPGQLGRFRLGGFMMRQHDE